MVSQERRWVWLALSITLLGAALRVAHLDVPSLWWDEFITLGYALMDLPRMWTSLADYGMSDVGAEFFPPLLHTILHYLPGLTGNDVLARLPSVFFGILSIPAIYVLGGRLFGPTAGILAAFLLATSGYHIHYSREVRPYSLFLLLNILSLACLHAGVIGRRARAWPVYALTLTATFYTSYMAGTVAAAHVLFTLLVLGPEALKQAPQGAQARRTLLWAILAWAFTAGAYLPWLPHQLRLFGDLYHPAHDPGLTLSFLASAFKEFAGFAYRGDAGPLLIGLAALGAWTGFRAGKGREILLLTLWAGLPLLGILAAKARIDLSSRYIINIFLFSLLLSAQAFFSIGSTLASRLRVPKSFQTPSALVLCLILASVCSHSNLGPLPEYYKREPSFYKESMAWLAENQNNIDWLLTSTNRSHKFMSNWYLRNSYNALGSVDGQEYKRAYLLTSTGYKPQLNISPIQTLRDFHVYAVGLVNASPIILFPNDSGEASYRDDFSTLKFYNDVFSAKNMAPAIELQSLTHYDYASPGEAVYCFAVPEGMTCNGVILNTTWAGYFNPNIKSQAEVEVSVSLDATTFKPIRTLTSTDFSNPVETGQGGHPVLREKYDLTLQVTNAQRFYVKIATGTITRSGSIELKNFSLTARLHGPQQIPAQVAAQALSNIAAHNTLACWRPGQTLVDSPALYAFGHPGTVDDGRVGTPVEHDAFRAANPGLAPVLTTQFPDGSPAYSVYDPALTRPFVPAGPALSPLLRLGGGDATEFQAVKLRGRLSGQVLTVGAARLNAGVSAPFEAGLTLNKQGRGELVLSPLFAGATGAEAASLGVNVKQSPSEECLTCETDKPCAFTMSIRSEWPVKSFRLVGYPRIFADERKHNNVLARYSTDGQNFTTLDEYRSNGSGLWEGWKMRRINKIIFPKPATRLDVRFELSGQGAQLWSARDARMRIEFELDTSAFTGLHPGSALAPLVSDQPVEVLFLEHPARFPDKLLPTH